MSTIDKVFADRVIAGEFDDDQPVRIVEYTNAWGRLAYGITFEGQDHNKYIFPTEYIRNPKIYWEKKDG